MNDLPQQLRQYANAIDKDRGFKTGLTSALIDAVDEIEQLEKELQTFKKLLRMVPERPNAITYEHGWVLLDKLQEIADASRALEGK